MRNKNRRILGWLLAAAMLLTVAPGLISPAFADDQPAEAAAEISKSKEVTAWDGTTAEITLSLPGKEETLGADVVFVLDASDCAMPVIEEFTNLLRNLQEAEVETNAQIKVGIIFFRGSAVVLQELEDVNSPQMTELIERLGSLSQLPSQLYQLALASMMSELNPEYIDRGSNMHSGIQAAEEMLRGDRSVSKNRKYLITVSDGIAYFFNDEEGNVCTVYGPSSNYPAECIYSWHASHKIWAEEEGYTMASNTWFLPESQNGYMPWDMFYKRICELVEADGDTYKVDVKELCQATGLSYSAVRFLYTDAQIQALLDAGYQYVTADEMGKHAMGMDHSVYECIHAYERMHAEGWQCYAVQPVANYQQDGHFSKEFMAAMNEAAGQEADVDFSTLQDDILYLLGAGSSVEDVMGEQFDFVNEPDKLKMRLLDAGGAVVETYDAEVIEENHYGFGRMEGNDDGYQFELIYDSEEDAFLWKINVHVTNFQRIQLVYTAVFSGEKETQPGTYGVTDLDGDGKEDRTGAEYSDDDAIYTNAGAVLYPVDSAGNQGRAEAFPSPSVSYTVKDDGSPFVEPTNPSYYILSYESNGGTEYPDERYEAGARVTIDKNPVRPHYIFKGWYADEALTQPVSVVVMDRNRVVYAAWEKTNVPEWLNGDDHYAYIVGYPDGMVHPEANITRAEVATIFFRLLRNEIREQNLTRINAFSDVGEGMWFNAAVSTMAKLNVVNGYPDGTFRPNETITRAEFAAIAARFDRETTGGETPFSDILGHWARTEIERAAYNGWINGYPDGTFRPDRKITRAESMALVNRVLARDPASPDDLLANMIRWPDNMDTGAWYYLDVQEATNSHDYERETKPTETWTGLRHPQDWTVYER